MRAAADAANRQVILSPHCDVAVVDAGLDLDDVAVSRGLGRRAGRAERLARPDA
jgi:hypothetical protein